MRRGGVFLLLVTMLLAASSCRPKSTGYIGPQRKPSTKPADGSCTTNTDCNNGQQCGASGKCEAIVPVRSCVSDAGCAANEKCIASICQVPPVTGPVACNPNTCPVTAADSDGDCLPDSVEDTNHDGTYEAGIDFTDLHNPDTDGDGILDGCEDYLHNGASDYGASSFPLLEG
jgi:hypothetical protein